MEFVKDLGSNINQDLSLIKMGENLIYDSQDFRVITDEGGTTGSRVNIKGQVSVLSFPDVANTVKIPFPKGMIFGGVYNFNVDIYDDEGNSLIYPTPISLLYSTPENWIDFLYLVLKTNTTYVFPTAWKISKVLDGEFSYIVIAKKSGYGVLATSLNDWGNPYSFSLGLSNTQFTTNLNSWSVSPNSNSFTYSASYSGSASAIIAAGGSYSSIKQTLPSQLIQGITAEYLLGIEATNLSGIDTTIDGYIGGQLAGPTASLPGSSTVINNFYDPNKITPTNNEIEIRITSPSSAIASGLNLKYITLSVFGTIPLVPDFNYTPSINNPKVIGWEVLRESIVLFTTDPTVTESNGQVWKLTYDKSLDLTDPNTYSLDLIYNSALNFSLEHPIPNPGGIVGRYENSSIQRLYWTDNYNPPRTINIADPDVYSLDPISLNLFPTTDFDIPQIESVEQTGFLPIGIYQYAYRLTRANGSQTKYSLPSPEYILTGDKINEPIENYHGPQQGVQVTSQSNKLLNLVISNVDTDYQLIDVICLYRFHSNNVPTISIIKDAIQIPNDGIYRFAHTGNETDTIPVSLEEYNITSSVITKVKTINAKSNTLFLANTTLGRLDIVFDSRAYRYPMSSSTTTIEDSQQVSYTVGSNFQISGQDIDETHDCIQDYDSQSPLSSANLLYLPNSTTFGGQGPNVKYTFITQEHDLVLDNRNIAYWNNNQNGLTRPHLKVPINNGKTYDLDDGYVRNNKGAYEDWRSPMILDVFQSYMRDEMYRFGIVFFDHNGNQSYTKWIADIRFPHAYMPIDTNQQNRKSLFPLFITNNDGKIVHYPLGIRFEVDVSSVASQIRGCSIVRMPLEDKDKHILGQGTLTPTWTQSSEYYTIGNLFTAGSGIFNDTTAGTDMTSDLATFKSPDFIFSSAPKFLEFDQLDFVALYDAGDQKMWYNDAYTGSITDNPGSAQKLAATVNKYYINQPSSFITDTNSTLPLRIIDTYQFSNTFPTAPQMTQVFASTGLVNVRNSTKPNQTPNYKSVGGETLLVKYRDMSNNTTTNLKVFSDGSHDSWQGYNKVYVFNYKRNNLVNQYNGNSYGSRSRNEYIFCNNFVRTESNTTIKTFQVYGGDTMLQVYDHVSEFGDYYDQGSVRRLHRTAFVPIETRINITMRDYDRFSDYSTTYNILRRGTPNTEDVNSDANSYTGVNGTSVGGSDGYALINTREVILYNQIYSPRNNIRIFPAKPSVVTENTEYDTRVYKTQARELEEVVDSWSSVLDEESLDVDAEYGPITNLISFKDKLFFIQERATGVLQIAEKQVIQGVQDGTSTAELILGSSGILERYDYISTKMGSKHQFSFATSNNSIVWYDANLRKVIRFSNKGLEQLTDIKGLSTYLYQNTGGLLQINDNPYIDKGVTSTYDTRFNEFLMTFLNNGTNFTVVYNEMSDGFTGFYSFYPSVYINDKSNIFSVNSQRYGDQIADQIYLHNYGDYGIFFPTTGEALPAISSLSYVMNAVPAYEKVLTNLEVNANGYSEIDTIDQKPFSQIDFDDFFSRIRVFDTAQNTGWVTTDKIAKRRKTVWNVKIPTDRVKNIASNIFDPTNLEATSYTRRLKDKYFICDLEYSNSRNNKFVVSTVKNIFTLNPR